MWPPPGAPGLRLFDEGDFGAFFAGRNGGGDAREPGADHDDVGLDGLLDFSVRNRFGGFFPGPARALRGAPFFGNVAGHDGGRRDGNCGRGARDLEEIPAGKLS